MTPDPEPTDRLYHYTSHITALDSIVSQMQLRLGLLEETNDPRESRTRYLGLQLADGADEGDVRALWEAADHLLRRSAKVACFTLDYQLPDTVLNPSELCGYAHPSLWAHYGGGHAGVCLCFSAAALEEKMQQLEGPGVEVFHGPVSYEHDTFGKPSLDPLDIDQINEFGLDAVVARYIGKNQRELFFRKHPDWLIEREYRWVLRSASPLPVHVAIEGCLRGIVLGDAFPSSRLAAAHQLASEHRLEITQIRFHNGRLQLLPSVPPRPKDPRPHRRHDSLQARREALDAAESAASAALDASERFSCGIVARMEAAIQEIARRSSELAGVSADVHQSIGAIPPEQRRRAPGVPDHASVYDRGSMCVVRNGSAPSATITAAIAIQVLVGDRVRLHAAVTLEPADDGTEPQELARIERECPRDRAACEEATQELITGLIRAWEAAMPTFVADR